MAAPFPFLEGTSALALNVYYVPTSDILHLRHALDIFQRVESSRNFGVVLT